MRPLPVRYCGIQHTCNPAMPSFELFTILEPLPNHPIYSTVSLKTIREAGYNPVAGEVAMK